MLEFRHMLPEHILARTKVLAGLDSPTLAQLAAASTTRRYTRGEMLWRAGDQPHGLAVVAQGLVKVVRPAPKGRSTICGLFGPTESVGDVAFVRNIPYPGDAIAATDVATVIEVPGEVASRCFERHPEMGLSLAKGLADKLCTLHSKIDVLSAGSVEARLATLLLELNDKLGDDFDTGESRIPVALSRRELADLVSTALETAIRTMSRWERHGVVSTRPEGFVIKDVSELERLAGRAAAS